LRFFNKQSIRRQLIAATAVLLLTLAVAMAWAASRTRLERRTDVEHEATVIAAMAAAQLEHYFAGLAAVASAVARHPVVRSLDGTRVELFLADLLDDQPLVANLVLTAPDGRVLGAAAALPQGFDRIPWRYIAGSEPAKWPIVSTITPSEASSRFIVMFGYPIRDDARALIGVLGLGVRLATLQTVFAGLPMPDGSVVTVTDQERRVVARSRDADKYVGQTLSGVAVTPPASSAVSLKTDLDGVERFVADVGVEQGAWTVSAGIPRTVLRERLRPLWSRNVAIVGATFLALMALGFVFTLQTTLHLNRLRIAAQRVSAGDLSPMDPMETPNLEFATLQDTFITMATNLQEARDALDRQMQQQRRMNEELQSLQLQVVRQERLTAVGLLVSGVAHEVNNPLQAILGTAELIERHPSTSPELLDEIVFLKTQAGRAREIIRNLSRFSSQQSGPPTLVDLREVISEVVQLRGRDLELASIALDVQTTSVQTVYASFTELEQVTLNFVINAQQALEGLEPRGRISIRLSDVGRSVRLEVLDNGPGVGSADEPKLFQPFFTTKPVGKGTGLGLSVSYGIIHSYGGTIGHTVNEWGGATFFFQLPAGGEDGHKSDDRAAVLQRSV
jgi:C4-dicarboxylate-specific signal transduction histidine kinase